MSVLPTRLTPSSHSSYGAASPSANLQAIPHTGDPRTPISHANTPGNAQAQFRITEPGSYYLTANICGEVGKHGIEILSANVQLDLMGFSLVGVVGSLDGIASLAHESANITVCNGAANGWGGNGVRLPHSSGAVVHTLRAEANGGDGVRVGSGSRTHDLTLRLNGGNGLRAGRDCIVERVVSSENELDGINAARGGLISHCNLSSNVGDGIQASHATTVTHCSVRENRNYGVFIGSNSTVRDSNLYQNGGDGLRTLCDGVTVESCTASSNGLSGIVLVDGGVVRSSRAASNGADGISVQAGGVLSGNIASHNVANGIRAERGVLITENYSIENARNGFLLAGSGNSLFGNSSQSKSNNYSLGAGNIVGPIVSTADYHPQTANRQANLAL